MENFNKNVQDKKSYFNINEHYKYFNCEKVRKKEKKTSKNNAELVNIKKEMFLTYEGMLRVLFASHSPKTKQFIKWLLKLYLLYKLVIAKTKNSCFIIIRR